MEYLVHAVCNIFIEGSFIELELTEVTEIFASEPVLVGVIVHSQDGRGAASTDPADPSLYFLPAVQQYSNHYHLPHFLDADNKSYQRVFLLVCLPSQVTVSGREKTVIL